MTFEHCRGELFKAIVRREVAFFDSAEVGVLTSRLGSDCQAVVRCLSANINVAARNSMQCIGAALLSAACTELCAAGLKLGPAHAGGAIYLAILSRELALGCLGMTVLLWAVALRFGGYSRASNRAYMAELANTNQVRPVFALQASAPQDVGGHCVSHS